MSPRKVETHNTWINKEKREVVKYLSSEKATNYARIVFNRIRD